MPLTVLLFFLLNRTFYCLFQYKLSIFFRVYSFWLHLLGILLLSNVNKIVFLSFIQIINLYSFNISSKLAQAGSVLMIGVWLSLMVALLPLYRYLYGELDKYFYINISQFKIIINMMACTEILKPIFQGIIHASLL
jgi:hypothetical protein